MRYNTHMQPSLEKLRKFFRLEAEKGYPNQAIIGGLEKVLDFWEGEARTDGLPEQIVQAVAKALKGYGELIPAARAEALKSLWKQIQEIIPDAKVEQPSPSRGRSRTGSRAQPAPSRTIQPSSTTHSIQLRAERTDQVEASNADSKPKPKQAPSRAAARPGGVTSKTPIALNASLTVLAGVGPRHAQMLAKLGITTLGDMLYYFPRRYDDYSQLKPIHRLWYGDEVTVVGTIQTVTTRPVRGKVSSLTEAVINDTTGSLRLTWFNQPWLVNRLKIGAAISVSGKIEQFLGRLVMNNPDWEPVEIENLHTNRIVPVYPLTANVTQKWLRRLINQVVTYWAPKLTDHLPESIRREANLSELNETLLQIHFPNSLEKIQAARQRLAFDEIFFLQMGVLRQKRDWQMATARVFEVGDEWLETQEKSLPYALTKAQHNAIADIRADLKSGKPMNRLIQGDVGSGKTIVATLAAAIIAKAGAQVAVMAPTSILAEQHYRSFQSLLAENGRNFSPESIQLLLGDTPEKEREEIRTGLAENNIKILIGTHALIEEPVQFADLQLAIIDEQHRFGVEQRAALRSKGSNPHLLVTTATPIPRSLALTIYGDLDLSIMDEMPSGRQRIETYLLTPQERERAYSLIRAQISEGHQAITIYPLIEEGEKSELLAATEEYDRLQKEVFPDLQLGLLHGRMRPEEKDSTMRRFRDGEFKILISTSVVEVGIDVPNATLILIEGANRFGLAQLHQLRGRVGRSSVKSYCLLIPDHEDAIENERLSAMIETTDGFVLAERDLQQRGPGEFLGTRQAGYAQSLRMANLSDVKMIEKARQQAQVLFKQDPEFKNPENSLLAEALGRFWGNGKGDVS